MFLTPGIEFLLRSTVPILLLCGTLYAASVLGTGYFGFAPPHWTFVIFSLVTGLGYTAARPWIHEFKNSRAAYTQGAVLAPKVEESRKELVASFIAESSSGYPGDV
jgi:hypothetical protein